MVMTDLPIPEEVKILCDWLRNYPMNRETCREAADVLEEQAGEIERLRMECSVVRNQRDAERARWQPIDTAPKDGTEILAGAFCKEYDHQFVASYDEGVDYKKFPWIGAEGIRDHRDFPTHWMPLPAAPQGDEK